MIAAYLTDPLMLMVVIILVVQVLTLLILSAIGLILTLYLRKTLSPNPLTRPSLNRSQLSHSARSLMSQSWKATSTDLGQHSADDESVAILSLPERDELEWAYEQGAADYDDALFIIRQHKEATGE